MLVATNAIQNDLVRLLGREVASLLAPIPKRIVDRDGRVIETTEDNMSWRLNDPIRRSVINWTHYPLPNPILMYSAQRFIKHLSETSSVGHAANAWQSFRAFSALEVSALGGIVGSALDTQLRATMFQLLNHLRASGHAYTFALVRQWYCWCADQQLPGFSRDVALELGELVIPGSAKGVAVMSDDPDSGPLFQTEDIALRAAMMRNQSSDTIVDRTTLILLIALGCNPRNLALCRVGNKVTDGNRDMYGDFTVIHGEDGGLYYSLNVPRIKKRGAMLRQEFKQRKLEGIIGEQVLRLVEHNLRRVIDPGCAVPLIMRDRPRTSDLHSANHEWTYHLTSGELTAIVGRYVKSLGVISPRTGEALRVTPRRLRYTFATRMAAQGCPPRMLAELLDHTDMQHVMVYYNARATIVEKLDAAMAITLGPMMKRFMGSIVDDASTIPTHKVVFSPPMVSFSALGGCGKQSRCRLNPPFACYGCAKFRPFRGADHQNMLSKMLEFRENRRLQTGNPRDRIAQQYDESIYACSEIIAQIEREGAQQ